MDKTTKGSEDFKRRSVFQGAISDQVMLPMLHTCVNRMWRQVSRVSAAKRRTFSQEQILSPFNRCVSRSSLRARDTMPVSAAVPFCYTRSHPLTWPFARRNHSHGSAAHSRKAASGCSRAS